MFYHQIVKGSIKFVILSILDGTEMYSYGLIQTVNQNDVPPKNCATGN